MFKFGGKSINYAVEIENILKTWTFNMQINPSLKKKLTEVYKGESEQAFTTKKNSMSPKKTREILMSYNEFHLINVLKLLHTFNEEMLIKFEELDKDTDKNEALASKVYCIIEVLIINIKKIKIEMLVGNKIQIAQTETIKILCDMLSIIPPAISQNKFNNFKENIFNLFDLLKEKEEK